MKEITKTMAIAGCTLMGASIALSVTALGVLGFGLVAIAYISDKELRKVF